MLKLTVVKSLSFLIAQSTFCSYEMNIRMYITDGRLISLSLWLMLRVYLKCDMPIIFSMLENILFSEGESYIVNPTKISSLYAL